jgi:diguanylate cyclase (GGDEF)-like protein
MTRGVLWTVLADLLLVAGAVIADRVLGAVGPVLAALVPAHAAFVGALLVRTRAELADARRDPVTAVFVRRVAERFLDRLSGEVTVALIDGDDLHGINQRFGHAGGDALLATVADRLSRAAVPGDLVARLGGDEFVLISRRPPAAVHRALAAELTAPMALAGEVVAVRVSAGVCRVSGGDHRRAFAHADRLMYAAKRRGGGIVHESSPAVTEPR